MTEDELKKAIVPGDSIQLIAHKNMKDVSFWPISVQVTDKHYEVNGIWHSNIFNDLIATKGNKPARETIKIKKEDLSEWKIVEKD